MATKKRIALVTGGNRGLGFETCRQLARLGLTVILTARDITKGKAASKRLNDKELDVTFYQLDVSDESNINHIADQVESQFDRIDVLVNNAAILYDTWENAVNADFETVNQAFRTNLFGPWRLIQKCIPIMEKNKYGRIVNVSSGAGSLHFMTSGGTPAYSISKVAINALTRILAAEVRNTNILINAIDPGWVATYMGGSGGSPVEEGTRGIVWAATLPENGPSGGFFYDGNPVPG